MPARPDVAIRVEGLTKRFGSVAALNGLDLLVPTGAVFGLLGPNGAGKTTTVRILATIVRPDAGRAEILGYDVVRDGREVRDRIGFAGQFAAVDENLTGRENLRLIGRLVHLERAAIAPRSDELLERFELTDAADQTVRTFSGGMRRRIDLAAALLNRPPVLFLDEPTTGLDPHSRNGVWQMISELVADGTTVVLTTQYLEEADRLAERVAVVDGGRVIAHDTPARLKATLGSTVLELAFEDRLSAARARASLGGLGPTPALDGEIVRLPTTDGARALVDALPRLSVDGLVPTGIAVREPSLDDVFLALTGRPAESHEQTEDPQ